jgi:hypothetical protein
MAEVSIAPIGSPGAIVEIFNNGEAYRVERFGTWVKLDTNGGFTGSHRPQRLHRNMCYHK